MYVIATIYLCIGDEDEAAYEVGADVTYDRGTRCYGPTWEVGEPDVSAPDCRLKHSRLVDTDLLPKGWSGIAEEALVAAYEGKIGDMLDTAADYAYERMREEDY